MDDGKVKQPRYLLEAVLSIDVGLTPDTTSTSAEGDTWRPVDWPVLRSPAPSAKADDRPRYIRFQIVNTAPDAALDHWLLPLED
jgi:hypothetical protein